VTSPGFSGSNVLDPASPVMDAREWLTCALGEAVELIRGAAVRVRVRAEGVQSPGSCFAARKRVRRRSGSCGAGRPGARPPGRQG